MKDVGNEICYEARHIAANMRIKPLSKVVIALHSFIFTTLNRFYEMPMIQNQQPKMNIRLGIPSDF